MLSGCRRFLLSFAIMVSPSSLAAAEFQIVNSSGKPIYELYLVTAGARSWGSDLLRQKQPSVIARGETYTLGDVPPGSYQLMMVVDGSECSIDPLDIATSHRIDLTPGRLRECVASN
jgi:hypothetical protein